MDPTAATTLRFDEFQDLVRRRLPSVILEYQRIPGFYASISHPSAGKGAGNSDEVCNDFYLCSPGPDGKLQHLFPNGDWSDINIVVTSSDALQLAAQIKEDYQVLTNRSATLVKQF